MPPVVTAAGIIPVTGRRPAPADDLGIAPERICTLRILATDLGTGQQVGDPGRLPVRGVVTKRVTCFGMTHNKRTVGVKGQFKLCAIHTVPRLVRLVLPGEPIGPVSLPGHFGPFSGLFGARGKSLLTNRFRPGAMHEPQQQDHCQQQDHDDFEVRLFRDAVRSAFRHSV